MCHTLSRAALEGVREAFGMQPVSGSFLARWIARLGGKTEQLCWSFDELFLGNGGDGFKGIFNTFFWSSDIVFVLLETPRRLFFA